MKSLVLAEKPGVARELARGLGCANKHKSHFEGSRYVVTWALGHLVELAEPEDYEKKYSTWKLEDLPIIPGKMRLKVIRQTGHQFRAVQSLMKRNDLSELIIATDAGREGELVARWIMELAQWRKPFKRLWVSSQTDKALKEAFANLRPGNNYDNLYHSAACRAEADWLIGLNVTRALACKFNAQLSAGRVQTPTLSALVKREAEIRAFKPEVYWTVEADFGLFRGQWGKGETRFFNREQAEEIAAKVRGKSGVITQLKSKERTEPHPLAYDLTELQRDANKKYGFSAKQTATILQNLYERHKLVTYPRTDSRYLSSDLASTLKERLTAIAVGPYAQLVKPLLTIPLSPGKRVIDDSKVTDHHAIIPTGERPGLPGLSADEGRLFDLIARRYIALFYPPCIYHEVEATALVEGEEFLAKGRWVKKCGWKQVYGQSQEEDKQMPLLEKGQKVRIKTCAPKEGQTQPPPRYTEASLLTVMEKHNLGTPATRADIIEKLLQTETIERKGNQLIPTGKGTQLLDLVPKELSSPELTAKWERELEAIAKGHGDKTGFLQGIRRQAEKMVKEVAGSTATYKHHNAIRSRCPQCGEFLLERKGKQGVMLVCPDRDCSYKYRENKQLTNRRCPQCHKKMELRQGKAGKFFQCKPCNVIEMLENGEGRKARNDNVKKYQQKAPLSSSLGDALKAALEEKK